uniref:Putative pectate lyase n=2 Tax=viral metagenome TaxID=1070528 RepID=A0A6M3IE62_9ZZZZ
MDKSKGFKEQGILGRVYGSVMAFFNSSRLAKPVAIAMFILLSISMVNAAVMISDTKISGVVNLNGYNNIKIVDVNDGNDLETKFSALNNGETLYIPCGTYEVDQELYLVRSNVTVYGGGMGCTIIRQAANANLGNKSSVRNLALMQVGILSNNTRYPATDVTIRDLTIDFNEDAQPSAGYLNRSQDGYGGPNGIGLHADGTDNLLVERVEVLDAFSIGIWLYGTDAGEMHNAKVLNSVVKTLDGGVDQIGIMGSGNRLYDISILDNYIDTDATNDAGIRMDECIRCNVAGNTIFNPVGNGIEVNEQSSGYNQWNTIAYNNLIGAFQTGIKVAVRSNYTNIVGNNLIPVNTNRASTGISVQPSGAYNVYGFKIMGNSIFSSYRGIYLHNYSTGRIYEAQVIGNSVHQAGTCGICVDNRVYESIITQNDLSAIATELSIADKTQNSIYDNYGATTGDETGRSFYGALAVNANGIATPTLSIVPDASSTKALSIVNTLMGQTMVSLAQSKNNTVIDIDKTSTGAGIGLDVQNEGTDHALRIVHNNLAATGYGLIMDTNGPGQYISHDDTNSYALLVMSATALTSTVNSFVRFKLGHASSTKPVLEIENDGTATTAVGIRILTESNRSLEIEEGDKICLNGAACTIYEMAGKTCYNTACTSFRNATHTMFDATHGVYFNGTHTVVVG